MINGEISTVANLFKVVSCLENAGKPIQSAKIAKLLNDAQTKDESFLSIGLSLQLAASKLTRGEQTAFLNRIPGILAKADEIDGRYLQFEGGLGVTQSIVKGIFDLTTAANKETTGLTSSDVSKFVNYFLSRLTVQTAKGAAELLQILKLLSDNKHHIPVVIALDGSNVVNEQNTNIVVRLTDTIGQTLGREFRVTGKLNDLSDILKFSPVQGERSTRYVVDLEQQTKKLPAGTYNLQITVEPVKKVDKLLVINAFESTIVIQSSNVQLDSVEIGVGEKDQLAIKHESVEYPVSLKKKLECDNSQKISIKFCVRDLAQTKDLTVQQALIYFVNEKTRDEIVFVADQDRISKVYNKDINLAYRGKEFNYLNGDYSIRLVVGDLALQRSISWTVAEVNLQFDNHDPIIETSWLNRYKERPEIVHQFRQAEPRPPTSVSHAFTLLCLSPVLVLIACWSKIGLNLSKFPFTLSAVLFHGSLLLIFVLYTLFFIRLNMFTTIKCLSGVLFTAFLSGYFLLKHLASKSS